jgi:hypothetical protein
MAKFKGVEVVKKIDKMLDNALAQFITNTQSKLSASSPVDTGRLASSWFVGKGQPDRSVAPEGIGKPAERETIDGVSYKVEGTNTADISITRYNGKITMDFNWFISNNLPYAERAAYDPGYVGRAGGGNGAWFSIVINNLNKDADRIFERELKKIK